MPGQNYNCLSIARQMCYLLEPFKTGGPQLLLNADTTTILISWSEYLFP